MCSFQKIEEEAKAEIEEYVVAAKNDPEPPLEDLFLDVYAGETMKDRKIRGCDSFSWHDTN